MLTPMTPLILNIYFFSLFAGSFDINSRWFSVIIYLFLADFPYPILSAFGWKRVLKTTKNTIFTFGFLLRVYTTTTFLFIRSILRT